MAFSGDRTPRASGQTGRGPGSQRGSLVRRGQRSAMAVRRDVPSRLAGDSPSGAEASSGPPDTCRSTGRGVEKATGIPPTGTPGNRGFHIHTVSLYGERRHSSRDTAQPESSNHEGLLAQQSVNDRFGRRDRIPYGPRSVTAQSRYRSRYIEIFGPNSHRMDVPYGAGSNRTRHGSRARGTVVASLLLTGWKPLTRGLQIAAIVGWIGLYLPLLWT